MTQQRDPSEIGRIFDAEVRDPQAHAELGPRYNVAPTQPLTVVVQRDDGRFVELHRWGLVPAWSERPNSRAAMINARAETVAASPAFRTSFLRRRCIVPADGFYEWRREGRARQPFLIRPRDGSPMAFAGLWAPWREPQSGNWLLSAAVVTTVANDTLRDLHDRMPVMLGPDEWRLWLDPQLTDAGLLGGLLLSAPDDALEIYAVSPRINSALNEGADLILPYEPPVAETLFG